MLTAKVSHKKSLAVHCRIEKLPNGDGFQYAAVNYVSKKTDKPLEGIGVSPDLKVAHTREALLEGRVRVRRHRVL